MTITQIELEELSVGADYEKVASRFRPVLKNCPRCNSARKERILPFEPIQWLKRTQIRCGTYLLNMVEMGCHCHNFSSF